MFKKCLAFVLCLILAAALTLPAMAENTQLTKLQGQWKSSAFRGTLTGEVTGEASKLTDPETWDGTAGGRDLPPAELYRCLSQSPRGN